jgi:VanZ family protein
MMEKERYIDRRSLVIASGMLLIIVYASLYRFRTRIHPDPAGPIRFLLSTWTTISKPSDVLANIVFYVPFGFFLSRAFARTRQAITIAFVSGLLLSFGMESLQFYIVRRYAAMSDVYADTLGALLGAIAAYSTRRATGPFSFGRSSNRFIVVLLVSWLGARLFPYVPVINAHKYWDALKPLIFAPVLPPMDVYRHAVSWLAIALLLEASLGVARSRRAVALGFSAVVVARILIARIALSPAEIFGGIAAVLAWSLLSRLRTRAIIVTALFMTDVVLQALEPFQFTSTARAFGWIPFRSFMIGPLNGAIISFFEKVFVYGCLIWLLVRSGCSWLSSTVWGVTLVMALRLIQIYLPGRSAEITDAIMVLIIAGIMKLISDGGFERQSEPQTASSMMTS